MGVAGREAVGGNRHLTIRAVGDSDMGFLYELLARRSKDIDISHKAMPTWSEHVRFWRREPYAVALIIELDGTPVGHCYVSRQNEIGIHLAPEACGNGIGPAVVRHITHSHPGVTFYANVSPYNVRSQRMFERRGWRQVQMTYAYTWPNGG